MQATGDRSGSRSPKHASREHAPRKVRRPEPAVVVRGSAIQGQGVFATRDIKKGARVLEYKGERISHEEATERYDDEAVERHHTFLFAVDDDLCIDGAREGNEARFINHSCAPNAYALIDRRRVFIVAQRNIKAGQEVVYDYWYTTDPDYTLADLKRVYPCYCGSPRCRGTLAGVKKPRKPAAKKAVSGRSEPPAAAPRDEESAAQ
jgi:SET domain-containing protein